ncbi:disease resistance protein RGA2-like [Typha angustifolia]|uniref:disease resistance protein RGA2-like n=1 Tax=Typha angustifolia TaxID=59011 RepID=UPI003C2C4970
MAEKLIVEGVKLVASPIVSSLLNYASSYLGVGVSTTLQDLETIILPQLQLMIQAAERSSEHKNMMEKWLRKFKDSLYEAEDVLDLNKYQLLKEKVSDLNTHPALKQFKKVVRKVNTRLWILSPQKIGLRRSLNKLEKIIDEAKTFRELLGIPIKDGTVAPDLRNGGQPNITTSFLLHKVFGRDKERDEIIDKYLLDPSEASEPGENYSVIAIVGIGGVGKTTLAQIVYNDQRVVNHFDIKMWVCVSRKLDIVRQTKEMIESVALQSKLECPPLEFLDTLQSKLFDMIKSKKVLLVLDDIWFDKSMNETEWQKFLAPLATSMKRGSKILVTTRTDNLPVALRSQYNMVLGDLEESNIISLFMLHAFGGTKLNDSNLQEELENIGKQIVQKLHRSPLAAKAVGGQLSKRLEVKFWRDALSEDNLHHTHQALLWSYRHLDAPLQCCFSYFSLFPKGHSFKVEEMIHLWMAEGFINSLKDSRRMEDIGMDYFHELVSGSFLQHGEDNTQYYMHDLFHDLAENLSKEDCLRIENDQVKEISPTIRHMYISYESSRKNNMSFNKLENLHTLIMDDSLSPSAIDHLFAAIGKLKKLRVLMLPNVSKEKMKLIADLKHLQFLAFYHSKAVELPVTFGKLYHLQLLSLSGDVSLPRSMKNLINLRHFEGDDKVLTTLPGIGRLTSLQKLPQFHVKKAKGYDIGQLMDLNELQGSLTISYLQNVEGKAKALEANLKDKKHLQNLHLEWGSNDESDRRRDLDTEVLESLQPCPNLIELTIHGCQSCKFPNWLLQEGYLQNLQSLTLDRCTSLEVLPPMSNLFPYCRKLQILNLPNLRTFSLLPQSLKELVISNCKSLNILGISPGPSISLLHVHLPKSLSKLELLNCPGILSLSEHLPESLNNLVVINCRGISSLPEHLPESLSNLELTHSPNISLLPECLPESLNNLHIWNCPNISSLPKHLPESLHNLKLWQCPGISSLPIHLPESLSNLRLWNCPGISSLPERLPKSLINLELRNCHGISSLPVHLSKSLNNLLLVNCPGILSLPDLPKSLTNIRISGCPVLKERCRSPNGEDWPKIAHIPWRDIM